MNHSERWGSNDTIAALATNASPGGIGIIRISGPNAVGVTKNILAESAPVLQPRHAHATEFFDAEGQRIDYGVVLWWPNPKSYTGEDMIEIYCHSVFK